MVFEPQAFGPGLEAAQHFALVIAMHPAVGLDFVAQETEDVGAVTICKRSTSLPVLLNSFKHLMDYRRMTVVERCAWVFGLGVIATLVGCRSLPPHPPMNLHEPGWTVRQGQAVWRSQRDSPEIAGDLLVAIHPDGRRMVQFTKPPFPFVVAQRNTNGWQAQFLAQKKVYSGRGKSPARIVWLQLPEALVGQLSSGAWRFEDKGQSAWLLENSATGESLEGFLDVPAPVRSP